MAYTNLNNGYGVTQFYHGSVSQYGPVYIAGAQDNGTQKFDNAGTDWTRIYGGDGGFTAIDPRNPDHLYTAYVGVRLLRSLTAGAGWASLTAGISSGGGGMFINPYHMDPNNPSRIYLTNRNFWRTDDADGAAAWTDIGTFDGTRSASALSVAPSNSNIMYIGLYDGKLYRVENPTAP